MSAFGSSTSKSTSFSSPPVRKSTTSKNNVGGGSSGGGAGSSSKTLPSSLPSHSPQSIKLNNLCTSFLSLCAASSSTPSTSTSTSPTPSPPSPSLLEALNAIRSHVLFEGIVDEAKTPVSSSLRGRVWKIMIGLGPISSTEYLSLVNKLESNKYTKIRGDSFRTFPKDEEFKSAVKEVEVIRVLNSFVHKYSISPSPSPSPSSHTFTYTQGMNTICAPFLYCMPEVEAFYSFSKLITSRIPLYWVSAHIGVEAGCRLVDQCLLAIDPPLYSHLSSRGLQAYVYAFHCVSSLSASIPPFRELLKLWDFLLCFGIHLNILCVVAQIISLRDSLLATETPKDILDYRKWPPLRAAYTISVAMSLLGELPSDLYNQIEQHGHNREIAQKITGRKVEHTLPA